jgi:hypothetical protein
MMRVCACCCPSGARDGRSQREYLGLFGFLLAPAPLALIVSVIAIRDIQQSKGTPKVKHGMGRAIFGLIVGVAGSVVLAGLLLMR